MVPGAAPEERLAAISESCLMLNVCPAADASRLLYTAASRSGMWMASGRVNLFPAGRRRRRRPPTPRGWSALPSSGAARRAGTGDGVRVG